MQLLNTALRKNNEQYRYEPSCFNLYFANEKLMVIMK